jgi:hypothetical protein
MVHIREDRVRNAVVIRKGIVEQDQDHDSNCSNACTYNGKYGECRALLWSGKSHHNQSTCLMAVNEATSDEKNSFARTQDLPVEP